MAEIRVEPKKSAPIWPWIIGILILLGLIWLLVEAFEQDDPENTIEQQDEATPDRAGDVGSLQQLPEHTLVLNLYTSPDSVLKTA